ncbi:YitT family protein [Carnobacterium mobile]|uniref:YitT family protein n=1 Tax=Carnobacterium mobile TaxID=2750 RepID=UPI000557708C|nr:YitT family protein [Carnobacterium mobile]
MNKEKLKSLLKIMIGNIFMAFAYAKWMKPNDIINGGVTSIGMILEKITLLPLLYLTNGVTVVLLVFCFIFLGKENFFKSFLSSICYMVLFSFFYSLPIEASINLPIDFSLASLFIAIGYYCCISSNASTVGMDVIALVLHKRNPKLKIALMIRYINFFVLAVGLFTYGWQSVAIGIAFSFVNSYLLNIMLEADKHSTLKKSETKKLNNG